MNPIAGIIAPIAAGHHRIVPIRFELEALAARSAAAAAVDPRKRAAFEVAIAPIYAGTFP